MAEKPTTFLYIFMISFMLFIVDVGLYFLLESAIFYLLLSFYIIQLYQKKSFAFLIVPLFFLSLESLLYFDKFGLILTVLIPATILARFIQPFLYTLRLQAIFMLLVIQVLEYSFIDYYLLGFLGSFSCTMSKIIANIIIILLISLK